VIGTVSCNVADFYKTNVTGAKRHYLAVQEENSCSFHRICIELTHMSLKPANNGVGYKGRFACDSRVQALLAQTETYGYTLWVGENGTRYSYVKDGAFENLETVSLRLENFDVENFGEERIYGKLFIRLADGTVLESSTYSYTLRQLLETMASNVGNFTDVQIAAVQNMIQAYETIMKTWNLDPIRNYSVN